MSKATAILTTASQPRRCPDARNAQTWALSCSLIGHDTATAHLRRAIEALDGDDVVTIALLETAAERIGTRQRRLGRELRRAA